MNDKEALNELRLQSLALESRINCNNQLKEFVTSAVLIQRKNAIDIGINALKKQIPENVIWKLQSKDKGTNNYECFCPFCNTKLSPYEHHCKCGQALIWSKVN